MDYLALQQHYDSCLKRYGDTPLGADWPSEEDRQIRYAVMLDLLRDDRGAEVSLLDFACGTGDLYGCLKEFGRTGVTYTGVDISRQALAFARAKFPPARFIKLDILEAAAPALECLRADYCVINGLFTVKRGLSDSDMWDFMTAVLHRIWPFVGKALAFNVMSTEVDWRRDDLFHVSLDRMAAFLHQLAGRAISFRADYGLFEYTSYVRKAPLRGAVAPIRRESPALLPSRRATGADMVCRPLLPDAAHITPYVDEIDRRRWYANFGETVHLLAARLSAHFGLESGQCVTASSATDALTAALIAVAGRGTPARPYCLMPSYTFVGTAAAALNAGYQPYFIDIDPHTFALEPDGLSDHPILAQAGAIIVVAPYGRPVGQAAWHALSLARLVPVIIDAAAGFDALAVNPSETIGNLPAIVSLHATKAFGVGEGGLILCRDRDLVHRCGRTLNFGFFGSREALVSGFNGKMSEYHAAVGLAELDHWPEKRAAYLAAAQRYRAAAARYGIDRRIIAETAWASSTVLYEAESTAGAVAAIDRLSAAGVDWRLWYGTGCHQQAAYSGCTRDTLPVTEALAPRVIGLPMAVDLAAEVPQTVIEILARR